MDDNFPDISVIIPAYNVATYIERAVHSALSQTGVRLEVIVIDDKSSDNTVAVTKGIHDSRLRIIEQAINGGPSVARNTGISAARGTWISILDGDDEFVQDRLLSCLNRAQEYAADIIVDNLLVRNELDNTTHPMFNTALFSSPQKLDLAQFINGNTSFLGGYTLGYLKPIFKAQFLKSHHLSYATNIRIGEDYLLMAEALACGAKCITEPNVGYIYTVRKDSISHRLNIESVLRIEDGDNYFMKKHHLSANSLIAQKSRSRKLRSALSFTELVEAIKTKNLSRIIKIMVSNPTTVIYLWRPIWARLQRILK